MNAVGCVVSLHIAPAGAAVMQTLNQVQAVAGRGLEGDRYFARIGTYSNHAGSGREVTLIESEAIEALKRDYGVEIAAAQARRNHRHPRHGLESSRRAAIYHRRSDASRYAPCDPCAHLEKLSRKGALRGLIHRGGLRAEIISGGIIRVGDTITPMDD